MGKGAKNRTTAEDRERKKRRENGRTARGCLENEDRRPKTKDLEKEDPLENEDLENEDPLENEDLENEDPLENEDLENEDPLENEDLENEDPLENEDLENEGGLPFRGLRFLGGLPFRGLRFLGGVPFRGLWSSVFGLRFLDTRQRVDRGQTRENCEKQEKYFKGKVVTFNVQSLIRYQYPVDLLTCLELY